MDELTEPDDVGVFEIALEAGDQEEALQRVWDAVAASGTDDHLFFLEPTKEMRDARLPEVREGGPQLGLEHDEQRECAVLEDDLQQIRDERSGGGDFRGVVDCQTDPHAECVIAHSQGVADNRINE